MSVTNTILQFNGNGALQHRGGTAAALASENPTPKAREIMIETDTNKFKIGDGVTAWNSLPYAKSESETWTFELEDGTTVTREVSSWTSGTSQD